MSNQKFFLLYITSNTTLLNLKKFTHKHYYHYNYNFLNLTKSSSFSIKKQSRNFTTIYNSQTIRTINPLPPSSTPSSPSTHSNKNENKPSLMILIGWWHCKPKHLKRYIRLYTEELKMDTLSHIPPFYHVFFPWTISKDIKHLANELIVSWKEHGKPDNVGFHVFSDNGTYHYAMLCDAIRQIANNKDYDDGDESKRIPSSAPFFKKIKHFLASKSSTKIENELSNNHNNNSSSLNITNDEAEIFIKSIKFCVIDSAPSPISEKYVALGIAGGFLHKISLFKPSASPISSSSQPSSSQVQIIKPPSFLLPILSAFFALPIVKHYQNLAHKALENIPGGSLDGNKMNYLFMYGPSDQIVPESDVIEFMDRLKKDRKEERGGLIKVTGKRFGPDSEHVQHFLRYPQEYINALKVFYGLS
ncbi:10446_t:CDS:2 [Entrophospora sp. SA101]|nr:10446_t:CDS:2 [Entrophospora sp. SA101]CAJ0826842.1 3859_t:CDS:2 [Entrophospora sp. SA101]CAJ0839264.1 6108_t:CDS:2 [Entrophospora sp. SA101]